MAELEALDMDAYLGELQFPPGLRAFIMCLLARKPEDRLGADELLQHPWFASNGIVDMPSAHAVVRAWLVDHETTESKLVAAAKEEPGGEGCSHSGKVDRASVRAHLTSFDGVLSDAHDSDHALLRPQPLSRANSTGSPRNGSSSNNSIKTEISDDNYRGLGSNNNSRNSSSSNLYARSGAGSRSNGPSPDAFDTSLDRLKSLLPAQKAAFGREGNKDAKDISSRFDSMSLAEVADEADGTVSSTLSHLGGHKRDRTLGSTDASVISMNTTTRTQSTANFTTGSATGYSDLNLSIVDEVGDDEDAYLEEGFHEEEAENSLDEVADELVSDYVDDDERVSRRPHLNGLKGGMDAKEVYYRQHK